MNKVYINSLQNIINNESCNTTYTPNLGEYSLTSTYGENIKIYYNFVGGNVNGRSNITDKKG